MSPDQRTDRTSQISIAPMLSVRNGVKAIEFYRAAFGAETLFRHDSPDGQVVAQLSAAGATFWLADESPAHQNYSPETLGGSSVRMVMVTENPDAVFDHAVRAGAKVIWPMTHEHGWRIGRVADPFGHHWEIGKPLAKTDSLPGNPDVQSAAS